MSSISQQLAAILAAKYGRDVRQAIHDSIEQSYEDVSQAKTIAEDATIDANNAAVNANAKATLANNAATAATTAATNATLKATLANDAATAANGKVQEINTASTNANNAATAANTASANANAKATLANNAATAANAAAALASENAAYADTAKTNANNAASNATLKAQAANAAADLANAAAALVDSAIVNASGTAEIADAAALNANSKALLADAAATAANEKAAAANTAANSALTATTAANSAAFVANAAAELANLKASLADENATSASNAASLAAVKAGLADTAATNANIAATNASDKAALAASVVTVADEKVNEVALAIANIAQKIDLAETAAAYAQSMGDAAAEVMKDTAFLNPRGAYNNYTLYSIMDIVTNNGSTYLYVNGTPTIGAPINDSGYWMVLAEKGDGSGVDGLLVLDGKLYLTAQGVVVSNGVTMPAGGGGGGSSGSITLTSLLESNILTIAKGAPVEVGFTYSSSEAPGGGTARIYVNEILKATIPIVTGSNRISITQHIGGGSNAVRIYCYDMFGNYKNIVYTINSIDLRITSSFDDSIFQTGDIEYRCIPYGAVEKTIHYLLDGVEIMTHVTSETGKQLTKTLPAFSHGVHRLDVYATAEVAEGEIQSAVLSYEIISIESGNNTPLIGSSYFKTTAKQGDLIEIPFVAYLFSDMTPEVTLTIESEGDIVSAQTRTVSRTKQFWRTRNYPAGSVTFTISLGAVSKTHTIEVEEVVIPVSPITNDLVAHLSAAGRANGQSGYNVWTDRGITTTFSNFNWVNNGWVGDENGDSVLRLDGPAVATINLKPFAADPKSTGLTIEVEYKIRNVNNRDAVPLSCQSGGIGFALTSDTGSLRSQQSSIFCNYKDEEKTRISFVIEPGMGAFRMMSMYLNGVLSSIKQYPATDTFQQAAPVNITIGSELCGIDIYGIRIYSTALTMEGIKDNFVADTIDVGLRTQRYVDNYSIYDEYGNISFGSLRDKMPVMVIVGTLPSYKGDKKTVKVVYTDPQNPSLNFEDDKVQIDVQGTSSQFYVRKNWKIKFPSGVYRQHIPGAIASRVFCMKADYADSTSTHNTQTANYVHELYDNPTPPQELYDGIRRSVQGFPCVIFHRVDETSDYEFHGKYNFNYDKDSLEAYGFTSEFPLAESWEFLNNPSAQCEFQEQISLTDTYFDTEENEERFVWQNNFEARQPSDYTDISKFKIMHDWVVSTWQGGATNANLPASYTGLDNTVYTKDSAAYRLAKFKKEFEDHFDMSASVTYYLFTLVMLMTDQRAKNMFLTTWDGVIWEPWFYDNDTILGINNEGLLVFDYFHEDIDQVGGGNVFNGQVSALWTNFREAFPNEIRAMYNEWRTDGRLNYEKVIDYYINHGSDKWPEAVYNEDSEFKYIALLKENNDASQLYQVRGTGEEHLRYFIGNRLKYMDSKFFGVDYSSNAIGLRLFTPAVGAATRNAVAPTTNVAITPYSNMYVGVRYGLNGPLYTARGVENTPVTISGYSGTPNDLETSIYGASEIASLGNIAGLYAGTINVAAATKLKELIAGSSSSNYNNDRLTSLSLGNNKLLSKLDVRGCTNLVNPIDLSGCPNIKEVYADRTKITGVAFGDSGYLTTISLPNTITNLTLKNQKSITSFSCAGYGNLTSMVLENVSGVPLATILSNATNLARVRLTDVDLTFSNTTILDKLATLGGIDESGNNTETSIITGRIYVNGTVYTDQVSRFASLWPELSIEFASLVTRYMVRFVDWDGRLLKEQAVVMYQNASPPSSPTRPQDTEYTYSFNSWSVPYTNVASDITTVAVYRATPRPYTVRWLNENGQVLATGNIGYGVTPIYPNGSSIPTKANGSGENWRFAGWSPNNYLMTITGSIDFTATFHDWNDPDEVKTGIGDYAFYNDQSITWASLPDTITHIGSYAFSLCANLALTDLPGDIVYIGEYAFNQCSKITCSTLPVGLTAIPKYMFNSCPLVTFANLPLSPLITTIGEFAFRGCPLVTFPTLPPNLTSIGRYAFYECKLVTFAELPSTITSIGTNAFYYCELMTCPSLPSGITVIESFTFYGCKLVTFDELPPNVNRIDQLAFNNCESITFSSFPDTVTSIGEAAFGSCKNVTFSEFPPNMSSPYMSIAYSGAFYGCSKVTFSTIPSNWTNVPEYMFSDCPLVTFSTFPSSIRYIGRGAFQNCTNVTFSDFPSAYVGSSSSSSDIGRIDNYVFSGCTNVTFSSIPSNTKFIGHGAFKDCSKINFSLPDGLGQIGSQAFENCTLLTLDALPSSYTGTTLEGVFKGCTGITSFVVPNSVTSVRAGCFSGCSNLTSITLGSNTAVGYSFSETNQFYSSGTFKDCTSLVAINLNQNQVALEESLFEGCTSLQSVTGGAEFIYFAQKCFKGCSSLTSDLLSKISNVYWGDYEVFSGCTMLPFPDGALHWDINQAIPKGYFAGCEQLTSLSRANRGQISEGAFKDCVNLTSIDFTNISDVSLNAFENCTGLTTLDGDGISVRSFAFKDCTNLVSVFNLSPIYEDAFSGCTNLSLYERNLGPTSNPYYYDYAFRGCAGLAKVNMSANTSGSSIKFAANTFNGCDNLLVINFKAPTAPSNSPWGAVNAVINTNVTVF